MPAHLLLLLVSMGELNTPRTEALLDALRSAVGKNVLIEAAEMTPAPDESRAEAVARITWKPNGLTALTRVSFKDPARVVDRPFTFQASDAEVERGRTVGFALAAMLPSGWQRPPAEIPIAEGEALQRPQPLSAEPGLRVSVEAAAVGSVGVRGSALTGGVTGAARFHLPAHLTLRVGAEARFGPLPEASASTTQVGVGAGIGWGFFRYRGLETGLRVDALALYQGLARAKSEGGTERQDRWLPGATLLSETTLQVSERFTLTAALGAEAAFGATEVVVGSEVLATVPPWRLVAAVGGRFNF